MHPVKAVTSAMLAYFAVATVSAGTAYASPIVGGWYAPNAGQAQSQVQLTFLANGSFFLAEDGNPALDPSGQDGMEYGTYSWNDATGAFTYGLSVNTNGQWGMSHSAVSNISVSGNTMTVTSDDGALTLNRIANAANPIVGSWFTSSGAGQDNVVITFRGNGTYFHAEHGTGDPTGQDGMERGTYTWNSGTGAFTSSTLTDTNGEWGLSHSHNLTSVFVNGDTMYITDGGQDFSTFTRVASSVPVPATAFLMLAGLGLLGFRRRS